MTDINKISVEVLIEHSIKDLLALQARLNNAIERRKQTDKIELAKTLHALANDSGFTLDELIAVKIKREVKHKEPAKAKYQHPNDPNLTWSGKGATPKWLTELCGTEADRKERRKAYLIK